MDIYRDLVIQPIQQSIEDTINLNILNGYQGDFQLLLPGFLEKKENPAGPIATPGSQPNGAKQVKQSDQDTMEKINKFNQWYDFI